jgi:hypothetical protein
MKHLPCAIATALAAALAAGAASAQSTTSTPSKSAPAATPKTSAPAPNADAPRGDTPVHRFFQAWGRGVERVGKTLDKVPKPDERWPGYSESQRRSQASPGGDPHNAR